jgi:hypothetical protein
MSASKSINEELRTLAADMRRLAGVVEDPRISRRLAEMADETLTLIASQIDE